MIKMENHNTNKGIGFCGVLAVAFVVLKLCHVIDWSWLWILSPIWIPIALLLVISAAVVGWAFISGHFEKKRELKKKKG